MLIVRASIAVGFVVLGATILVRILAFGIRAETIAGLVLGIAMVALGVHRISLILRLRGAR